MALHRRRFTPAAAVRLALILGANLAAAAVLWSLLRSPDARAGGTASADAPLMDPAAASERRESDDDSGAVDRSTPARGGASPNASAKSPRDLRESAGRTDAPSRRARLERLERLERIGERVRAVVARAERRASELTQGKVAPRDVEVSVHLRDVESGASFGIRGDEVHCPASNLKLATTAAAMVLLGPDWEFVTPIEARGELVEGRLSGDLVLRAAGDPLFDPEREGSVAELLRPAIDELLAAGLREVRGGIVLDEGTFDPPARPVGWPDPSQRTFEYCALSGGFTANRGCLTISVAPRAVGSPAAVHVEPAGFGLEPRFEAVTSSGGKSTLGFDARATGLIVRGTIARGAKPFVDSTPVPDPVLLFAGVLRHELAARGIRVEGPTRRERGVANAPGGRRLASIRTPLARYLAPIHQESNNAVADQVYLATANAFLGNAGRAGAERATMAAFERLGVARGGFRQVDGSGLSDANRISAAQLTALLCAVGSRGSSFSKPYLDSLAVAGESGTLRKRMRDSPARGRILGKTGFIEGVSSLSGFALPRSGGTIAFSILVNYKEFGGLNTNVWKPMGDDICELLVGEAP